jgi:hypothetical protein
MPGSARSRRASWSNNSLASSGAVQLRLTARVHDACQRVSQSRPSRIRRGWRAPESSRRRRRARTRSAACKPPGEHRSRTELCDRRMPCRDLALNSHFGGNAQPASRRLSMSVRTLRRMSVRPFSNSAHLRASQRAARVRVSAGGMRVRCQLDRCLSGRAGPGNSSSRVVLWRIWPSASQS